MIEWGVTRKGEESSVPHTVSYLVQAGPMCRGLHTSKVELLCMWADALRVLGGKSTEYLGSVCRPTL